MKKAFVFVVMLILGCSTPPPKELPRQEIVEHRFDFSKKIHVDSRFSKEEVESVKSAANEWSKSTHGSVNFEIIEGFKVTSKYSLLEKTSIIKVKSADGLTTEDHGDVVFIPGCTVYLVPDDEVKSLNDLKSKVIRMMGVDLGLPEFKGPYPAAMNSEMSIPCLTKYDMMLFCTRHACDWKKMGHCPSTKIQQKDAGRSI